MPGLRYETSEEEAAAIEQAVIAKLLAYGRAKGIGDPIVRDLLPDEDLKGGTAQGVSGHVWKQSISACRYHTIYSGKNDKDRAFAIFKVAAVKGNPLTAAIRFHDGTGRTKVLDIWQVEHAWLNPDCEAYCEPDDVIFFGIEKGYNIDFLGGASSGYDNVILGGKVVETRGKTITPKPAF